MDNPDNFLNLFNYFKRKLLPTERKPTANKWIDTQMIDIKIQYTNSNIDLENR